MRGESHGQRQPCLESRNRRSILDLAGHDVDVVVVQCGARKHGAVGVESRAGDRRGAVVMEETGVWFEGREVGAVRVEGLDFVAVGTPNKSQLVVVRHGTEGESAYTLNTGACSCTLKVRSVSLVALMRDNGLSHRRSHSRTSPLRLPEMSSRIPPRWQWTFVIHCLCSRQTLTIEVVGFSRWSKTRTAPSPKPAMNMLPAT